MLEKVETCKQIAQKIFKVVEKTIFCCKKLIFLVETDKNVNNVLKSLLLVIESVPPFSEP